MDIQEHSWALLRNLICDGVKVRIFLKSKEIDFVLNGFGEIRLFQCLEDKVARNSKTEILIQVSSRIF